MKHQDITTVVYTILTVPLLLRSLTTASSYVKLSKTNNGLLELQVTHGKLQFLETSLANSHSVHRIAFTSATDGLQLVRIVTRGGFVDDCITSTSSRDISSFASTFSQISGNAVKLSEAGVMDAYLKFSKTTYPTFGSIRDDVHDESNISSFISPERTDSQSVAKFPDFRLWARMNASGTSLFLNMFRTHLRVAERARECETLLENAVKALQIINIAVHTGLKGTVHLTTVNKTLRASLQQRHYHRFGPDFSGHMSEESGLQRKQEEGTFNMSTSKRTFPSDIRAVSSAHTQEESSLYRKQEVDPLKISTSGVLLLDVPAISSDHIHKKSNVHRNQKVDPLKMSTSRKILSSDVPGISKLQENSRGGVNMSLTLTGAKLNKSSADILNIQRSMNYVQVQNESVSKTLELYSCIFVSGLCINRWQLVNVTERGAPPVTHRHLGKYKHIGTDRNHQTDRNRGTDKHIVLDRHSRTGRYHRKGRIQGSDRQFKLQKQNESDIEESVGYKRADRRKATHKRRMTEQESQRHLGTDIQHVLDRNHETVIYVGTDRHRGSEKHHQSYKYNESDGLYASYKHHRTDELRASDRHSWSDRLYESIKPNGHNKVLRGDTQHVPFHRADRHRRLDRHHRADGHRRLDRHHRADRHRRLDRHQKSNIHDQRLKHKSDTNDETDIKKRSHRYHRADRHHRSYRHNRATRHHKSNRRNQRHKHNSNTNDESNTRNETGKYKVSHRHHAAERYGETDRHPETARLPSLQLTMNVSDSVYTSNTGVSTRGDKDAHENTSNAGGGTGGNKNAHENTSNAGVRTGRDKSSHENTSNTRVRTGRGKSAHENTSNTGVRTGRDRGTHAVVQEMVSPKGNLGRSKRDLLTGWMIFPGTKWCGDGDVAEHKRDMGYHSELDACCRRHDLCPLVIPRLTWKYGIFNYRLHTLSHCRCDRKLRKCLQASSSPLARLIGQIYFNVIGPECFKFTQRSTCVQRLWWGGCQEWSTNKVAYSKRQRRFK